MGICYALERITAPASEPVTLAEAKLHLRVDGTDEDTLISTLIMVAREAAEQYLRRSLITQSWQLSFEDYALARTELPMTPIQSITSVKSITRTGTETTLSSNGYYLAANQETLCFDAAPSGDTVRITYAAGYGDTADDVPTPIKQGILCHITALYEGRTGSTMPEESFRLYAPYRTVSL